MAVFMDSAPTFITPGTEYSNMGYTCEGGQRMGQGGAGKVSQPHRGVAER
jgi:hypothetical protein